MCWGMGGLASRCGGKARIGWIVKSGNLRGAWLCIRMVQQSGDISRNLRIVLCTLMYGMCHVLRFLSCDCAGCGYELDEMVRWGVTSREKVGRDREL